MAAQNIPTIYGHGGPLTHIPDDVTIPQFFFDQHHQLNGEALHLRKPTYFIEDATGRHVTGDEVSGSMAPFARSASERARDRAGGTALTRGAFHLARYARACSAWRTRCTYGGTSVSSVHQRLAECKRRVG